MNKNKHYQYQPNLNYKGATMKQSNEIIYRIILAATFLFFSGCIPEPMPTPHYDFQTEMQAGEKYEQKTDLFNAREAFKDAKEAATNDSDKQKANVAMRRIKERISKAEKITSLANKYFKKGNCQKALKQLDKALAIFKKYRKAIDLEKEFIKKCGKHPNSSPIAITCESLDERAYKYQIRRNDMLSELCQRIYGKTEKYQFVYVVARYNAIYPSGLKVGQTIKFPTIQCGNAVYRPKESSEPSPVPEPEPGPDKFEAHLSKGESFIQEKNYVAALDEYNKALDLKSDCSECIEKIKVCENEIYKDKHYKQGIVHFDNKQYDKAIAEFDLVLSTDPEYLDVKRKKTDASNQLANDPIHQGEELFRKRQFDAAIDQFEKALVLQSDNRAAKEYLHKAFFEKAVLLFDKKRFDKCLAALATCFEYEASCQSCGNYKRGAKKAMIYNLASAFEKAFENSFQKRVLERQIKALKLLKRVSSGYKDAQRRLHDAQKRLKVYSD
jgi:tetratricopeptide (TPR) repeat protein